MGSFSLVHWLIVAFVIAIFALPVVGAIWFLRTRSVGTDRDGSRRPRSLYDDAPLPLERSEK